MPIDNTSFQSRIAAQTASRWATRQKLGLAPDLKAPPIDPRWTKPLRVSGGIYAESPADRVPESVTKVWDAVATSGRAIEAAPMPESPASAVLTFTAGYMNKVHNPEFLLDEFNALVPKDLEFDTLVGAGLSGTIAVTELARRLDRHYLVVRKENDGTHSAHPVEGKLGKRWLFVDDTVSSGRTFCRVWNVIDKLRYSRGFSTEYVGRVLYTDCEFYRSPSDAGDHLLQNYPSMRRVGMRQAW